MDNLDNLPDGIAARLRQLEDDEDDDVDHSIPTAWGVSNTSDVFRSEAQQNLRPGSSASNSFAISDSSRGFARAFAPLKKRVDPYESQDQQRGLSFSSAVPDAPGRATWDSYEYDPTVQDQSETSRKSYRRDGQESATGGRANVNELRNRALEGTFSSTSVKRITEEGSEYLDLTLPDLDPLLDDPNLDIDPNVRANFLPISQLHRAPAQRSAFALRNPSLIASNTGSSISTVIAGETITYTPKSVDTRLGRLDRHGKYIGEYEGEIKKSLKRQYMEDVNERDRQMLQATAEYRALAAMSPDERAELLERLRKPYEWHGAFPEDQHDEPHIPEVYTRNIPTDRVLTWMEDDFSRISIAAPRSTAPSDPGSATRRREDSSNRGPVGSFGDLDDFASGSSYVPLAKPPPRTQQYFRDALRYGEKPKFQTSASQRSSSTLAARITSRFDRTRFSDAGASQSFTPTVSSRGLDGPFSFDDSPELQVPDDCPIESELQMTPNQEKFYQDATTFSREHGRIVLVHLHELVKFTPGAIAGRVFGGFIQAMQLFPVQRVAIVIFLHPSEAKAFVRHVKKVHESGQAEEIRALQIEAGWYKGIENPHSILPIQPHIFAHHITSNATRCLRLHHLPATKAKEDVSSELGHGLAMPLLAVILCPPKISHLRSSRDAPVRDERLDSDAPLGSEARLGRQAIVEFVSISDAIRAREALVRGEIQEYEDCEPVFAGDPCVGPGTERSYCSCAGCREVRKQKGVKEVGDA